MLAGSGLARLFDVVDSASVGLSRGVSPSPLPSPQGERVLRLDLTSRFGGYGSYASRVYAPRRAEMRSKHLRTHFGQQYQHQGRQRSEYQ